MEEKKLGKIILVIIITIIIFGRYFSLINIEELNQFHKTTEQRNVVNSLNSDSSLNITNPYAEHLIGIDHYNSTFYPVDLIIHKSHLFIGAGNILEIFSIRNPENPKLVGTFQAVDKIVDIEIINDKNIILANGEKGIEIVGIRNKEQPYSKSVYDNFSSYTFGFFSNKVKVTNDVKHAYVSNKDSFAVMDISDLEKPKKVKEMKPSGSLWLGKIYIHQNKLYVATDQMDWSLGRLYIYDITDADSPSLITTMDGFDSVDGLFFTDRYLFLGFSYSYESGIAIRIYDLENEINITRYINEISPFNPIYDIYVQNDIAFVNHGNYDNRTLTCINVSDIMNPIILSDYLGQNSNSWLLNLEIEKDILFINEGWNGIHIFRLENWDFEKLNSSLLIIPWLLCVVFVVVLIVNYRKKLK